MPTYIRNSGAMLAAAALIGCSSTPSGPNGDDPPGPTAAVNVQDNRFTPATARVTPGGTVTWTWSGSAQHNVRFDDGQSSSTQTSGTYARTFQTVGEYPYHCTIHGTGMSGTVRVVAAGTD